MKKALSLIPLILLTKCVLSPMGIVPKGMVCSQGDLGGAWQLVYKETSGTCGPQPTETVTMNDPIPGGCALRAQTADGCEFTKTVTCLTNDGGTQTWTTTLKETFVWELNGSGTMQIKRPSGNCQSTYAITATKI